MFEENRQITVKLEHMLKLLYLELVVLNRFVDFLVEFLNAHIDERLRMVIVV